MNRRKLVLFALAAMVLSVAAMAVVLLGADLYLHHRAERSAGLNRWGYRGPVVGRKAPGEVRIAMLGGSTTFGYGVTWDEALPAMLERELQARPDGTRFRTINLGFNNEGAFASVPTMADYAWLDYDIVALYHGYNDILGEGGPNTAVYRHDSPVFRLTGYFPILPLALQEKAMAIRAGGNLDAAYEAARHGAAPKVTFTPNAAQRTSAGALEALSGATLALANQLDKVTAKAAPQAPAGDEKCERPWRHFCDSMYRSVKYARDRGVAVLVIAQPNRLEGEMWARFDDQRRHLEAMVARDFGSDPGVRFADLSRAVNPTDTQVSFDGMHLNPEGNRRIAQALVEPVIALARQVGR